MKKISNKIHWEKCRNISASIKYCQKDETRNGQIWKKNTLKYEVLKKLSEDEKRLQFEKWRIIYTNHIIRNLLGKGKLG